MEQLSFHTAQVEGPLDLILQLIRQHKLNIYDIEIGQLLEQYLLYLQQRKELDLEVSSEFLEMASRLVYMKSVSLLPRHEEEEQQLKSQLSGQLIEYSLCKQVAALLRAAWQGNEVFGRRALELPPRPYDVPHRKQDLLRAYLAALGKQSPPKGSQQVFEPLVARRLVSISSRVPMILRRLYEGGRCSFLSLFEEQKDRAEIVATFLAVLELVKRRRLQLSDDGRQVELLSLPSEEEQAALDSLSEEAEEADVPEIERS